MNRKTVRKIRQDEYQQPVQVPLELPLEPPSFWSPPKPPKQDEQRGVFIIDLG